MEFSCGIKLLGAEDKQLLGQYTVRPESTGSGMGTGRESLFKFVSEKRI